MDECYICGGFATEMHHAPGGSYRKKADKYGLVFPLCRKCHRALHDKGVMDKELKAESQRRFEERYSHELWMKEFGKNWRE